ncbi:hypothetical protein ACODM8_03260 [Vibrio ostreicida]|uniref:hypothetical protein n=1 Tax=Vibrio ostreicida TaxID=526588 RepID=UPI003B5A75DC
MFEAQTEKQREMLNNPLISPKTQKMKAKKQAQKEAMEKEKQATTSKEQWLPVEGNFPLLVYETQKKMDDFDAPDMTFGDEERSLIESYGFTQPFKNKTYYSPSRGYDVITEDQFKLPASEHFKRMRSLADDLLFGRGFSSKGETKAIFFEMVNKFERNEGGILQQPIVNQCT